MLVKLFLFIFFHNYFIFNATVPKSFNYSPGYQFSIEKSTGVETLEVVYIIPRKDWDELILRKVK